MWLLCPCSVSGLNRDQSWCPENAQYAQISKTWSGEKCQRSHHLDWLQVKQWKHFGDILVLNETYLEFTALASFYDFNVAPGQFKIASCSCQYSLGHSWSRLSLPGSFGSESKSRAHLSTCCSVVQYQCFLAKRSSLKACILTLLSFSLQHQAVTGVKKITSD